MQGMREFLQGIGHFWAITISLIVVSVLAVTGLYLGGVVFASKVVLPTQKNLAVQSANNQYSALQASQAYQQTFQQQADKDYQQVRADEWNAAQAVQANDQTMITEANAAIAADLNMFCKNAQKLTPASLDQLGPGEHQFYMNHC